MNQVVLVIALLLVMGAVYGYNRLVRVRNLLREAWSGIDVQLKRRHDLIPNIAEIVKGYSRYEHETLTQVTELRSKSELLQDRREIGKAESDLSGRVQGLLALVEKYPELKADENFRELQASLVKIEDDLQYARRYYNGTVRDFNTLVLSFPLNMMAQLCGFVPEPFFEIVFATERAVPDVKFKD